MCTAQMDVLLQGMGSAIKGVTSLTVHTQHTLQKSSRIKPVFRLPRDQPIAACPAPFAAITRMVCAMIAPAVPGLRSLHVMGCCRDAGVLGFGAACPQLTHLLVEPLTVPIKALLDVHRHLPNLHTFTLKSANVATIDFGLTEYAEAALHALRACASLQHVALECDCGGSGYCIGKGTNSWPNIPANLVKFSSTSEVWSVQEAGTLLGNSHTLQVDFAYGSFDLSKVFTTAPHLQTLVMAGNKPLIIYPTSKEVVAGAAALGTCLLAGFKLEGGYVQIAGQHPSVRALLLAMPPLMSVTRCTIHSIGQQEPIPLEHIAHAFPNLKQLSLFTQFPWEGVDGVGMELLVPLAACTSLEILDVGTVMSHTLAELAELCMSIPSLKLLRYIKSRTGVCPRQLQEVLFSRGHKATVEVCRTPGELERL